MRDSDKLRVDGELEPRWTGSIVGDQYGGVSDNHSGEEANRTCSATATTTSTKSQREEETALVVGMRPEAAE